MDLHLCLCLVLLTRLRLFAVGQILTCHSSQWQCDDGSCISAQWRCDGEGDCLDGTDEMDCDKSLSCPRGQFSCVDSMNCVDLSARCDGKRQCPTGYDEENCEHKHGCLTAEWTCNNLMCIAMELHCNGENDCLDNSDEQNCGHCDAMQCDGRIDCADGRDEPVTCGRICSLNNGGCSHSCVDAPWGALCSCPAGYELSLDGAVCKDVDECALPRAPCMHSCVNTVGSYYCQCREGFMLEKGSTCLATGNITRLLTVQRNTLGLLDARSRHFNAVQFSVLEPVALAFDFARALYYWADGHGHIHKTDGRQTSIVFTGQPGIQSLACDWLNGQLYWTNQETRTIYMQVADGKSYTTVLSKNVNPSDLVLLAVESLMFWINAGAGERVTIEKSWMDGTDRNTLVVLTAQAAHGLTADVAARTLYWISNSKRSIETVKVDGTGRYSFRGVFSRGPAQSLTVFEQFFYWSDKMGLWQTPVITPNQRRLIWKDPLPLISVFHELQQPQVSSPCAGAPCQMCLLTKSNTVGFTCICPNTKVLLSTGMCEYPRVVYGTFRTVNVLEFKDGKTTEVQLFTTDEGILSFDVDWYRDWIYWANKTGHLKRKSLTQVKTELIQTSPPVCQMKVDQRSGNLYWVSCDQKSINVINTDRQYTQKLYGSRRRIEGLYLDWVRGGVLWLEQDHIFTISMMGGKPIALLHLGGGVVGKPAFDLRANSLLWNSNPAGLVTMSLFWERSHIVGKRWNVTGSVVFALEPFLLSLSDKTMTLWDRRDGKPIQSVAVQSHVLGVVHALKDFHAGTKGPSQESASASLPRLRARSICKSPSVLCQSTGLCISPSQVCDGFKDCPDGFDENNCVKRCASKNDFLCKDRRSCVSQDLVCDGRAHCIDGSDEMSCGSLVSPTSPTNVLKCRHGSKPCRDGSECVLFSHVCDGQRDCNDGSDEDGCDQSVNALEEKDLQLIKHPPQIEQFTRPPTKPACRSPSSLCPGSSVCILDTQICDGRKDCPDGSDEECVQRCPYMSDFLCKDRRSCVSQNLVCDGRAHCLDASDERNCQSLVDPTSQPSIRNCRFGTKSCADGSECVPFSHVCDGQRDCVDGSDEDGCDALKTSARGPDKMQSTHPFTNSPPPTKPACRSPSSLCPGSSVCILDTQICDGRKDCPDGSDEECVQRCRYLSDFLCKDRRSCVSQNLVCDGRAHCLDASDERNCQSLVDPTSQPSIRKCRFGTKSCADGSECVPFSHVCDGQRDCVDGSDEDGCDGKETSPEEIKTSTSLFTPPPTKPACRSPSALCPGSSVCILDTQFCDGRKDCPDGSDEKCVKRCRYKDEFLCKDRRSCVSRDLVCDGRAHCIDGSDERNCPSLVSPTSEQNVLKCRYGSEPCQDGSECVLFSHVCDGQKDCNDGSDEDKCDHKDSGPTSSVNAVSSFKNEFKCAGPAVLCPESSLCILPTQFCDGKLDCPGGFDENCETRCPDKSDFLCKDYLSCVSKYLVCNGHTDCSDGSDEFNCPNITPTPSGGLQCPHGSKPCRDGTECVLLSHLCDGEDDCRDASDELLCPKSCKEGEFQCAHGKLCILSSQVCDGKVHCLDHSDELNCWKQTKSCEFHCLDGKRCIPKTFLCDGEDDCEDGTDERGCDFKVKAASPSCNAPSIFCPGTTVCVSQSQLCDGKRDCPDGFDEQGCILQCENPADFLCQDRRNCIPSVKVCDGRAHCFDSSDEKLCTTPFSPLGATSPPLKCRLGFKLCRDGLECVMYSHVCDGELDCKDGSDEEDCVIDCKAEEFQCAHGKLCIPKEQVCDGQSHCQDRSDEMNCKSFGEGCHQWCDNDTRCIPDTFLCDGERDCADGSDEFKCDSVACTSNEYQCQSGQCVSQALRCDGYADCGDHSDEKGCSRPPRCPTPLRCPNTHECLQKEWICDGENDCADGADEKICKKAPVRCKGFQWSCGDRRQCIPLSWRCDGKEDCENGKDEVNCSEKKCAPHLFKCGSGECLDPKQLCNTVTNCADRSDEGAGCNQRNCSSSLAPRCDHDCIKTPSGPRCFCAAGFQLQGVSCVDIDECSSVSSGVCKHICLNTRGSYACQCHPGFFLEPDKRSCKAKDEALLLASVLSEMVILGVHSATLHVLSSANRPVFSLDYDWVQNRIYWLSSNYQSIRWAEIDNTNNKGTLIKGVKSDFIAVDWVGKNLYWVDGLLGQILAVKLSNATVNARDHTVVLGFSKSSPSSLVLVSHKGLMFWSEMGASPQIEQAGMDGSKRKVVVNKGLSWPVSLAFDVLDNRIYWADEKLRCIGSASMDGDDVKILQLAETPSPFSVSVFNDRVFWSDTKKRSIRSADKKTGKDQRVLVKRPGQPFALKIMHPLSQPLVPNPCEQLPCSHVCLLAPAVKSLSGDSTKGLTAVCRCPKGLLLSKNHLKCTVPVESTFIMLLSLQTVYQIHLRSMYSGGVGLKQIPNGQVLALPAVNEASAMDACIPGLTLYVADAVLGTVDKLKLSDSRSKQPLLADGQILKLSQDDSISALAVDWVTSNLYWSSSKRPNLHVTSEKGHTVSLLPGSMKGTTSIAVHPPSGRLCYTAVGLTGTGHAEVSCAWMDGRKRTVLWRKSSVPTSLVFSDTGTDIYWADTGEGIIYNIGVDGSRFKQYKTGPGFIISFTFIENFMLWMTFDKDVTRLWFSDGLQPKQLWFETKISLTEVKAYSNNTQSGSNSCAHNNGRCAHLCLPYPGGNACRCGLGFYTVNVTSCASLPSCPSDTQPCPDGSKCISTSQFCDSHEDCHDGSDEQDCPYVNFGLPGAESNKSSRVKSPLAPSDARSQKKSEASCDLACNGHGSCVTDGTGSHCQCVAGYKGDFCQFADTSNSGRAVGLGLFFAFVLLIAAILIYVKRRDLALAISTTREKETLMSNISLPSEQFDYDAEELDSPVDEKSPGLTLESLQLKQ